MPVIVEPKTPSRSYVGRQPILDRDLNVFGYELLYRESGTAAGCSIDTQTASAVVMANAMLEFGLEKLTRGTFAFFNCSAAAWDQELFELLPADQVVLEVLEEIPCDDMLERTVRHAKELGYRVALDDIVTIDDRERLLPYVDIVKLELPALTERALEDIMRKLEPWDIKVLAEKVETQDEFTLVKDLGCDYFQGYFFAKPKTVSSRRLPQAHLHTLQLLSELSNERASFEQIAHKVAGDLSLSVRILRYANSASVGARREISSIQKAMTMIGLEQIRKWAQVIALSGLATNKPSELMYTALTRARFCELVAARGGTSHPSAFTVGLLSLLDAMLDRPLEESFEEIPLSDELVDALLRGQGRLGECLAIARAYESFQWSLIRDLAERNAFVDQQLNRWFVESISEAKDFYALTTA